MTIVIKKYVGEFGENKDVARDIRVQTIMPALEKGRLVKLDFAGVSGATQSFVHALISDAIRTYGDDVYDLLIFVNCNEVIKTIINIVADYMEES
ncbi:MAG: STAS-like domain-containing protein [Candidatus Saccharimonadales bacterium]